MIKYLKDCLVSQMGLMLTSFIGVRINGGQWLQKKYTKYIVSQLTSRIKQFKLRLSTTGDNQMDEVPIKISLEEAKKLCKRLEYDASWDKVGTAYYSLKRQIKEQEGK